ncbi:MAG TPA: undecaprenyl-diphosphate phosphatase, partial [Acidimicrobiales bacterium]|nr:undecaprenyl-diphosphate phosphatase [Acidimicrobiales bacterium]
ILAAGVYKIPDLFGPNGDGVRGQVLAGSVVTFFVSLLSVRFLVQYFKTRNLIPFATYCLAFGAFMTIFVVAGL